MAKLDDAETIRRKTLEAHQRHDLDLKTLLQDRSRLCPGCNKPIAEQRGTPRTYFNEKWCEPCFLAFVDVARDHQRQP